MFDRLLDTAPLDPGDAAGLTDVVTTMAGAGAPVITLLTDYSSTGAADGLVFNLFGPFYFGNFRAQRPQPVLGAAARVSLGHDHHRHPAGRQGPRQGRHDAVHGQRPAAGRNAGVHDGAVQRRGGAGHAADAGDRGCPGDGADPGDGGVHAISPTRPPAGPRLTRWTTDPPPCTAVAHTSPPPSMGRRLRSTSRAETAARSPSGRWAAAAWPAGATVVVTVDAATTNLLAQPIDAAASATFTGFAVATP